MKTTRRIAAALLALAGVGTAGAFTAAATAAPGPARTDTHELTVVTYNVGDPSDAKVRADLARLADRRPEVMPVSTRSTVSSLAHATTWK